VRDSILNIDRGITVYDVKTLNEVVADSIALPRFSTLLSSLFAGAALLLTVVGIYGVVSYTVSQQSREIGIRIALGAQAGEIMRWALGKGMRPTLTGILLGLASAFLLMRFVSAMLFGVKETDLITFGSIALLVAGVALMACYLPARRAARVDPIVVLRCE
jgi:putative ABC transport system permease protein